MGGVLEGVRVLDFGRYIAGPYCATLLAEFGAEVIRVEKRDGSEDRFVAPVGEGGEGALFLQINRNKKCITLDPMKPEVFRRPGYIDPIPSCYGYDGDWHYPGRPGFCGGR